MIILAWVLSVLGSWVLGPAAVFLGGRAAARGWRKLRARCARLVSDQPARDAHYPGMPCDGGPLSVPERERLEQIRRGMWKTASEPGRQR